MSSASEGSSAQPPVVIIPGWRDSGPTHWQSIWLRDNPHFVKLEQSDWEHPGVAEWCRALDRAIADCPTPPVLVAHSLGCALVAHWSVTRGAESAGTMVHAAMLVGPADADSPDHTPEQLRPFAPIPLNPLGFHSIVVTSRSDPYVTFARAIEMARSWGSELVDAGDLGHINVDSGHGPWPLGESLLGRLLELP